MSLAPVISNKTLPALLQVFDTPNLAVLSDWLYTQHPKVAEQLVSDEWVRPLDRVSSIDINGQMRSVRWYPEQAVHQYFSSRLGWVDIASDRLHRYQLNKRQALAWFVDLFTINKTTRAKALIDNALYYLGETQLNNTIVTIYLCSRLSHLKTRSAIQDRLQNESYRGEAIVVCNNISEHPLSLPPSMHMVELTSVLVTENACYQVDRDALARLLPVSLKQYPSLRFSDDYRLVYWHNQRYYLSKKQSAIVEALHQAGGKAHKDYLRAQAETNSELYRIMRKRVNDQWVQNPLWGSLIVSLGQGYYALDENAVPPVCH